MLKKQTKFLYLKKIDPNLLSLLSLTICLRYKKSILDDVPGVGKSRKTALLRHFKTFKAIREATVEELAAAPSMNKVAAEALYNSIREKK